MPVEGLPDAARHKLCLRCRKWHEPDEGIMVYPEATGPLSGMRRAAAVLAGDESAMRFMCHHCLRVRKYTKAAIFGAFGLIVLLVFLLERLGYLR
jgi:hypothetical protein